MSIVEGIKCLVRPIVTYLVIASLVGILIYLVIKFADLQMARDVVSAFLVLVALISGVWFGSRGTKPPAP